MNLKIPSDTAKVFTKIIPESHLFVVFEAFCALQMSRKERLFQGITCDTVTFVISTK